MRLPVSDETTNLNFRHLLERHGLTEALFAEMNAHLADKDITLRSGTLGPVEIHLELMTAAVT
jgi:IS5 family transposase